MREVTAEWDPKLNAISYKVPPLSWLFNGEEVSDEIMEETRNEDVMINLTFNDQEWIDALSFRYHDCTVKRMAYITNFGEELETEEEKQAAWLAPDPVVEPPEEEPTEEEIAK